MTAPSAITVAPATPDDRPAWDAFVAACPQGDVLQAWAWGDVVRIRGERAERLVARGADGTIRGLAQVLVRPTLLGHTVLYAPHGPLWERGAADGAAVLAALLDGLAAMARAERGIVVKVDPRGDGATEADLEALRAELGRLGLRPTRRYLQAPTTQVIPLLDGGEALRATWHSDARRNVNRAGREGVVTSVTRDADPAPIGTFHDLLTETAERGGFKGRSVAFLQQVADAFAPAGGWYLCLARKGDRAIGGMVILRVGDRGYYLYGASTRDPAMKHAHPGYAAMAGVMAALAADGARELDAWGVADVGSEEAESWTGFSFFKQRFGGDQVHHAGTFDLVISPPWYALRDLRERLLSRS